MYASRLVPLHCILFNKKKRKIGDKQMTFNGIVSEL